MAGERADTDQTHLSGDGIGPADSAQQLNEIELIEEVVLVPEDQLVVRLVIVDDLAPAAQLGNRVRRIAIGVQTAREVSGANVEQLFVGQLPWNRPLVQRICPDR